MVLRVTSDAAVLKALQRQMKQEPGLTEAQLRIKDEYLRSLDPHWRACYQQHLNGETYRQIASALQLEPDCVREILVAICVELRMRLLPLDPGPAHAEPPLKHCVGT